MKNGKNLWDFETIITYDEGEHKNVSHNETGLCNAESCKEIIRRFKAMNINCVDGIKITRVQYREYMGKGKKPKLREGWDFEKADNYFRKIKLSQPFIDEVLAELEED